MAKKSKKMMSATPTPKKMKGGGKVKSTGKNPYGYSTGKKGK